MLSELIEDVGADGPAGKKPAPSDDDPRPFGLAANLRAFSELVIDQTVPRKKKGWRDRLAREWTDIREQFSGHKAGTQKLYISKFRRGVLDALKESGAAEDRQSTLFEEMKDILVFDEALMEEIQQESRDRIRNYSTNLVRLPDWEGLVREFSLLLHHPEPRYRVLGLLATTGRRSIEIIKQGRLERAWHTRSDGSGIRVRRRWEVAFSGQAKTRGAVGTLNDLTYVIPVLAEAKDILEAFDETKRSSEGQRWADMNPKQLNGTVNKQLNRALQGRSDIVRRWPEAIDLSVSALRPFYAEVAFRMHAPETMTKSAFFARILGHATDDYQSSLSYMRFALGSREEREAVQEIKKLKKLYAEQQEAVDADRETMTRDGRAG